MINRLRTRLSALVFLVGLFTAGGSGPANAACSVSVGIPGNAPFTGMDGPRVTGAIAQAAVEVLRRLDCAAEPRELPFPRMYSWVHDGRLAVATSVLKTPDRARQAHYTRPVMTEYTVVMVPRGGSFPLDQVADLQGRRIGGRLGFKYPPLDGLDVDLQLERSYEINIRKVANGRLDGVLIGSITGPYLAEQLGLAGQVEFLPNAIGKVDLGLALSREWFTADQRSRLDDEIASLQQSSRWREILSGNDISALVRAWPVVE